MSQTRMHRYNISVMTSFSNTLLDWYQRHKRPLPWRDEPSPYTTLVSELMLQQTRVETMLPYYERWMQRFPTMPSLASAPREEVLQLWEGLGYYRRAHNLHRTAQIIVQEYKGAVPRDIQTLLTLPGVGRYTAAAIAAFAFNQDELALDGNLRRVLARVMDLALPVRSRDGESALHAFGERHLPPGRAADFNQALMDLGTAICTPRNPICDECPLHAACKALSAGTVGERPVKKARKSIPHVEAAAGVLLIDERVLLGRRPEGKLLGGLWEFPGGKPEDGETLPEALAREWQEELGVSVRVCEKLGVFAHTYSHFHVTVHAFSCDLVEGKPAALDHSEIAYAPLERLASYPMGKVDRAIADTLRTQEGITGGRSLLD